MSDTTPPDDLSEQRAADQPAQPPPPAPWLQTPRANDDADATKQKANIAELFGLEPDAQKPANSKQLTPPWEAPLTTSPAGDEDLFDQRVRQAAKELADSGPAKSRIDESDPLDLGKLAVPDAPPQTKQHQPRRADTQRPGVRQPLPEPAGPGRPVPLAAEKSAPPKPPPDDESEDQWTDESSLDIVPDHRLSGAFRESVTATARPRSSRISVEPGEPLALPTADPQYLKKLQKDLSSDEATVIVRYGAMLQTGLFEHHLETPPAVGADVVIRSDRGVELGKVVTRIYAPAGDPIAAGTPGDADGRCAEADEGCGDGCSSYGCTSQQQMMKYVAANGPKYPFRMSGKLLRIANTQDLADARTLAEKVGEQMAFCRQQIADLKLDMKLVTMESLLGGERIVFYFTSEDRVDFRELVRRLSSQYHVRVELRQVGARDEARLVGDFERCGRQCCCQTFIKELQPVSMRMAKLQKATLDPLKISGRCSRLMCCLRYEDESYKELRKYLPKKNSWVQTASLIGQVVDTDILTQLVRLQLPDNSEAIITSEEIIARDVEPPTVSQRLTWAEGARAARRSTTPEHTSDWRQPDDEPDQPDDDAPPAETGEIPQAQAGPAEQPAQPAPEARGKRRRGRRKKSSAQQAQPGAQGVQTRQPSPGQASKSSDMAVSAGESAVSTGETAGGRGPRQEGAPHGERKDGSSKKRRRRRRKKKS